MTTELALAAYAPARTTVWERKAEIAEYVAPAAPAGADVPFARWTVVAEL